MSTKFILPLFTKMEYTAMCNLIDSVDANTLRKWFPASRDRAAVQRAIVKFENAQNYAQYLESKKDDRASN